MRAAGGLPRRRRAVAVAVRLTLVVALSLAAAEPRWAGHRHDTTVVFLIDRSASVSDDALAKAWKQAADLRASLGDDEHAAVIQFDGTAEVAIAPGNPWAPPAQLRGKAEDATDVAGAMRLGLGLDPPGAGGHLVLLGDGRATDGDSAAATGQRWRVASPSASCRRPAYKVIRGRRNRARR